MSDEGLAVDSELCTSGGDLPKEKIPLEIAEDTDSHGAVEFISLQKSKKCEIPTYLSSEEEIVSPKRRRDCMLKMQKKQTLQNMISFS